MHIFFRMHDGSYVAFFEIPESPPMGRDRTRRSGCSTSRCACPDMKTLMAYKKKLEKLGIEVVGPTDHTICKSIYFFDPNGHRLELAVDTTTPAMKKKLAAVSKPMLKEWTQDQEGAAPRRLGP